MVDVYAFDEIISGSYHYTELTPKFNYTLIIPFMSENAPNGLTFCYI